MPPGQRAGRTDLTGLGHEERAGQHPGDDLALVEDLREGAAAYELHPQANLIRDLLGAALGHGFDVVLANVLAPAGMTSTGAAPSAARSTSPASRSAKGTL